MITINKSYYQYNRLATANLANKIYITYKKVIHTTIYVAGTGNELIQFIRESIFTSAASEVNNLIKVSTAINTFFKDASTSKTVSGVGGAAVES
jgi:hypothetical protein